MQGQDGKSTRAKGVKGGWSFPVGKHQLLVTDGDRVDSAKAQINGADPDGMG